MVEKRRPREKVCDISVIWIWGIVMQDLKFYSAISLWLLTRLYMKHLPSFTIYTGNNKLCLKIKVHDYYEKFI
jgi:hypothetical protein